jgi:hypothetical protein
MLLLLLSSTAPPTCCLLTAGRKEALTRCLPEMLSTMITLAGQPLASKEQNRLITNNPGTAAMLDSMNSMGCCLTKLFTLGSHLQ